MSITDMLGITTYGICSHERTTSDALMIIDICLFVFCLVLLYKLADAQQRKN